MKTSIVISILVAASFLAGCAAPETDPTPTPTVTTTTATPSVTPTATPTPATPTPGGEGPPAPMECHGDYVDENATGTRLGMPELTFTIQEPSAADPCYAFIGPAEAESGWNVFTLEQPGMEFHIMPMYFIGNRSMGDLVQAFSASEQPPEWAVPAGAVGGVTAHQNGSVAIDLDVGNYVYFCPIGGHMFQGMIGQLNVTQAANESAAPTADATIELVDFNFTIPANLTGNMSVIKVVNNGTQPHEAPLVILTGNATATEFIEAIEAETPTGPPPGALVGGVNAIAPGQTVYILRDLSSGERYALACFVSSPDHGGAPHMALGMIAEFEIA